MYVFEFIILVVLRNSSLKFLNLYVFSLLIFLESMRKCIVQIILNLPPFQVNTLLSSLDIDNDIRARGPIPGRFPELEEYWNESQGMKPWSDGPDGWVSEFGQHRVPHDDPNMWVQSFERQHGANSWASEFERVRKCFFLYFHIAAFKIIWCS